MQLGVNHPKASWIATVLIAGCLVVVVVITTRDRPALASGDTAAPLLSAAVSEDGWGPPGEASSELPHPATPPAQRPTRPTPEAAVTTAEAVMSAFARSTASDPSWWPGVVGYLSAQARLDYVGVDPSQVPFTAVTGAGEPLPSPDGDGAEALVRVPTDAGDYVVRLQSAADGSVEVVALTPPAHPLIGTAAAIAAPQENGAGVP